MKKLLSFITVLVFVLGVVGIAKAATYDASGMWNMGFESHGLTIHHTTLYIYQYHSTDTFSFGDNNPYPYYYGDITETQYEVTSTAFSPISVLYEGPIFLVSIRGRWEIGHITNFTFDLSSPNNFTGTWDWHYTGWFTNEPNQSVARLDPGLWFYDEEIGNFAGAVHWGLTGSKIPIPSAVWLLGVGLIGLVGFRKKFRKPNDNLTS